MATRIRLARAGAKKRPFYRIVAADVRAPRDGKFIEKLGTYNPLLGKDDPNRVTLNAERISHWLGTGATPSDRVEGFLVAAGLMKRSKKKENLLKKKIEASQAELKAKQEKEAAEKAKAEAEKAAEEEAQKAAEAEAAAEAPAEETPAEEAPAQEEAPAAEAPKEEAPAAEEAPEDGEAK